ncbi:MAG: amino acid adenylation domain-containing protein [Chitinophagaceae bacterium]
MEKIVNKAFQLLQSARRNGVFISVDDNQLSIKYSKENNIEPHLLEEIKNNKALIIDFLNEKKSKLTKAVVYNNQIRRIPKDSTQPLPLSFSQERLWFIDRLEGSVQYHVPAVWRLQGELNKEALSRSLHDIVQRHEVLRTVILEEQGQAFQFIMDTEGWQLAMFDGLLYREDKERLQQDIQDSIREPFDLSKDYMLRASLITLSDQEHMLIVTTHHIASDGWSTSILVNELMELYNAYDEDRPARLAPLPIQYCDYALWERNYLQGEILDKKVGYWKDVLKGVAVLQLPTDHQRPSEWRNHGASLRFGIDKLLSDQLQVSSKRAGTTLFMTMLAAFKILLHRYSGQEDICVGSPIANRTHEEIEGLIGFFVNTLALRSEVKAESSFTELLKQVKVTTMEAYEHQDVPFEKVVEVVVKERDLSRSPLFQVMFSLLNTPEVSQLHLGEVELSGESYENLTAQFDISFDITETGAGLQGSVQYSTDLYNESTIVRMMDHFITLLNSIVKAPEQKIGELAMLTKEEEQQLLVDFNDTVVDYPKDKTIVDLFEEQALKTPEGIAIIFEEKQLNYQQLNEKANQLAHYLRSKGVKEETLVPICIERSMEMIVGILGILKAGGAYVPIDPEYPEERISYMLEDTGAAIVVSSKESRSKLKDSTDIEIIELDGDWKTLNYQLPTTNDQRVSQPHHLAYVIYTSGSTGSPKGVMIEHASLINYVLAFTDYFSICSKDVVIQQASISFDTSAEEIYPALIAGGCICLIKEGGKDIDTLKKYIENDVATILSATPRLIDWLNKELVNTGKLRYLISGGEALNSSNINNLFSQVSIANGYGPSEATIAVIFKKIDDISQASVIGKPFANTAIYILGTNNNLSPVGVAGEICIGGAGLARGYLNRPDLTKEKFVPDPFNNKPGARMYKTGDLGRWLADGNIEYIGREDNQVKIRGYRIELGEIEAILNEHKDIEQAVVIVHEIREEKILQPI